MIKYIDFVPKKRQAGLFKQGKVQVFQELLDEMNNWILNNEDKIDVSHYETVILPNIHDDDSYSSEETELWAGGSSSTSWYQLIRLWYKRKK